MAERNRTYASSCYVNAKRNGGPNGKHVFPCRPDKKYEKGGVPRAGLDKGFCRNVGEITRDVSRISGVGRCENLMRVVYTVRIL